MSQTSARRCKLDHCVVIAVKDHLYANTVTNMSTSVTRNRTPGSIKEPSNYAVIRLKASDSLINLFQLLLQNGYNQVSFVNSLNQTIFPFIEKSEKGTQTIQTFDLFCALNGTSSSLLDIQNYEKSAAALTSAALLLDKSAQSLGLDFIPAQTLAHLLPIASLPTASQSGFLGLPTVPSLFSNHAAASTLGNGASGGSLFSQQHKLITDSILGSYSSMNDNLNNLTSALSNGTSSKRKFDVLSNGIGQHSDPHAFKKHPAYQQQQQPATGQHCLLDGAMTVTPTSSNGGAVVSATNTQLRQRGQRGYADDPSLYVTCRLCKNRIMGSRVSNLTNHVRRHSSLKQFQCCYCEYTHNEMAKVRLHMLHNHKDKDSQPIDNLSPEMQSSWEFLMKECFPDHHSSSNGNGGACNGQSALININRSGSKTWKSDELSMVVRRGDHLPNQSANLVHEPLVESPQSINTTIDPKDVNLDSSASEYALATAQNSPGETPQIVQQSDTLALTPGSLLYPNGFPCLECSEVVHSKDLLFHVYTRHLSCVPVFFCSACGLGDSDHEKLKRHVVAEHCDAVAADAQVLTRDIDYIIEHYLPQFFSLSSSVASSSSSSSNPHRSPPGSDCSDGATLERREKICERRPSYGSKLRLNDVIGGGVQTRDVKKQPIEENDNVVVELNENDVKTQHREHDDVTSTADRNARHRSINGTVDCKEEQRIDECDEVKVNVQLDKAASPDPAPSANDVNDSGDLESLDADKSDAYNGDARLRDAQRHVSKSHYVTSSRRRLTNHVTLRHNNVIDRAVDI